LKTKKEFGPKDRTEAAAKELTELMEKYHCVIDIQHKIVIVPLEMANEMDDAKKKD
jgi:hypothetical protein